MNRAIKPYEQVEATLKQADSAWDKLVGHIRFFYSMDELWDEGKPGSDYGNELKFRCGGKTLVTLYLRDNYFEICLVFGKNERAIFEEQQETFVQAIRDRYNKAKTFHDGKWIYFKITDLTLIDDIIRMLHIKRKPNRKKDLLALPAEYPCGVRCDLCLINIKNNQNDFEGSKMFHEMDWNCYHDPDIEERVDYTKRTCAGCEARKDEDCQTHNCLLEKGFSSCVKCGEHHTCGKNGNIISAGRCNIGLSREDVTHCVIPYCGKERLDYWKKQQSGV